MGKLDSSEQTCYREVLLTTVQYSSPLIAFLLCVPFSFSFSFLSPFFIQYMATSLYDPWWEFQFTFCVKQNYKSGKCLQSSIHISSSLAHRWLFEPLHSSFTFFWSFWWIFDSSWSSAKFSFSQILVPKHVLQMTLLFQSKIAFDSNKHEVWFK